MKLYSVALIFFLLNLSLAFVQEFNAEVGFMPAFVGSGGTYYCTNFDDQGNCEEGYSYNASEWTKRISGDPSGVITGVTDDDVDSSSEFSWWGAIYQFVFKGLPKIATVLFSATIGVLPMLTSIGIPLLIAVPISAVVYLTYVFGVYQLVTDRSLKNYQ